jgi:hypothetical protein
MHAHSVALTAVTEQRLLTAYWLAVCPVQVQVRIMRHVLHKAFHNARRYEVFIFEAFSSVTHSSSLMQVLYFKQSELSVLL